MAGVSSSVRLAQLQSDADACGPEARALFDRLITEGKTPEAAAMYACQQAPGTRFTDRAFCDGQRRKMEKMSPLLAKALHSRAKAAGIDSRGKYYVGGLGGGRPDNPDSWVTSADDVLAICKKKNLNADGVLNYKAVQKEQTPQPQGGLAPDIVNSLARKALRQDPALRARVQGNKRAQQELREQIIAKHSRKKRPAKSSRLV